MKKLLTRRLRVSYALIVLMPLQAEWLTFGHDPQRSGWATEETKINAQNVGDLQLKWSAHLDNVSLALNAVTAPVVARDVITTAGVKTLVYVAGSSNHLFAIDASSGVVVWQRTFQSFVSAKAAPYFLCPNAVNATPVIDRAQNMIFAIAYDGRVFGLDLGTGSIRFGPFQLVPAFAKPWSLNLKDGVLYTTTSQSCGGDRSGVYSMRVDQAAMHSIHETLVRSGSGAGMWSRGGSALDNNGRLFVSTGDGMFDPLQAEYGSTFLAVSTPELKVVDYFSPLNRDEVNKRDLDLPLGGLLWFAYQNFHLLAGGGKESVMYLLDADLLGKKDHQSALDISPPLGNETKVLEEKGFWGSPALWKDAEGQPWLYVPLWGAPSKIVLDKAVQNGAAPHGSVVAFRVVMDEARKAPRLQLAWISADVNLPDAPVVANGVVFVAATGENPRQNKTFGKNEVPNADWKQNLLTTEQRAAGTHAQVLMGLDAKTGKLLYQSGDAMKSWNHFGGLAIDDGKVYAVDHGSNLYCFEGRKSP